MSALQGHVPCGPANLANRHLRDEDVAHAEHAQAADLLGRVEDDRREAARHLAVQPDLDALRGRTAADVRPRHQGGHCASAPHAVLTHASLHSGTCAHTVDIGSLGSRSHPAQQGAEHPTPRACRSSSSTQQAEVQVPRAPHRLDLVLALDQQVQQLLRVHRRLPEVRHQPDQRLRSKPQPGCKCTACPSLTEVVNYILWKKKLAKPRQNNEPPLS